MFKRGVNGLLLFILFSLILVLPPQVLAARMHKVPTTAFDTSNTLSPQLIIGLVIVTALIALVLVLIFYPDKLRARLSVRAGASWMIFSYSHIETGESIQVGEWLDEIHGDQRIITFKPTSPLLERARALVLHVESNICQEESQYIQCIPLTSLFSSSKPFP